MKILKYVGVGILSVLPFSAFATELLPMPGNWLDLIATSSVPLINALWTPILFFVGIAIVGFVIGKITGH